MRKNLITGILVLVCGFSLIFVTGCAKDQAVKSDVQLTQAQPSAEETAQAQAEKAAALKEQALKEKALEDLDGDDEDPQRGTEKEKVEEISKTNKIKEFAIFSYKDNITKRDCIDEAVMIHNMAPRNIGEIVHSVYRWMDKEKARLSEKVE